MLEEISSLCCRELLSCSRLVNHMQYIFHIRLKAIFIVSCNTTSRVLLEVRTGSWVLGLLRAVEAAAFWAIPYTIFQVGEISYPTLSFTLLAICIVLSISMIVYSYSFK